MIGAVSWITFKVGHFGHLLYVPTYPHYLSADQ
jgi:hypothetical protein